MPTLAEAENHPSVGAFYKWARSILKIGGVFLAVRDKSFQAIFANEVAAGDDDAALAGLGGVCRLLNYTADEKTLVANDAAHI